MNRRTFVFQAAIGALQVGMLGGIPLRSAGPEYKGLRIDVKAPDVPLSPLGMPGLLSLGGSLQSTPILTDESIYLATSPSVVYALRKQPFIHEPAV